MKTIEMKVSIFDVIKLFIPGLFILSGGVSCVLLFIEGEIPLWGCVIMLCISLPWSFALFWEIPESASEIVYWKAFQQVQIHEKAKKIIFKDAKKWLRAHLNLRQDDFLYDWFISHSRGASQSQQKLGFRDISPTRLTEEVNVAYEHLLSKLQEN